MTLEDFRTFVACAARRRDDLTLAQLALILSEEIERQLAGEADDEVQAAGEEFADAITAAFNPGAPEYSETCEWADVLGGGA